MIDIQSKLISEIWRTIWDELSHESRVSIMLAVRSDKAPKGSIETIKEWVDENKASFLLLAEELISFVKTSSFKRVTSVTGKVFDVNISNEACGRFGFKYGERIFAYGKFASVIGVAPYPDRRGKDYLWYSKDEDKGKVSCVSAEDVESPLVTRVAK